MFFCIIFLVFVQSNEFGMRILRENRCWWWWWGGVTSGRDISGKMVTDGHGIVWLFLMLMEFPDNDVMAHFLKDVLFKSRREEVDRELGPF